MVFGEKLDYLLIIYLKRRMCVCVLSRGGWLEKGNIDIKVR